MISENQIGDKNYWFGKHRSEKTKRKQSESMKEKIPWNKGKHHSEETKEKIRNSNKGQIPWNKKMGQVL